MSQKQVFTNTFLGGMKGDMDRHIQQNSTYRFAISARLLWNSTNDPSKTLEENVKNGVSLAIVNARGNRFEIALCDGYKLIGSINSNEGTLMLLTNGINSEIGIFDLNDNIFGANHVKYTTLFNDRFDPNGDKLNFKQRYYAHGFYVYENEFTRRFYWTDGHNQKRVINLALFFDKQAKPIHKQGCDAISVYPKSMSVHAFDERMDLVFPRLKFQERIVGRCKSGQYQLVIKYLSDNSHSSVWSPDSRSVFVTDQKMDGSVVTAGITYDEIVGYQSNHHNRTMGESNIMTDEGLRWQLTGIDTRWDKIVVGYIYHTTSIAFQEATEYKTLDITGSEMTVDIIGHTGTAITKAELNQRFETQMSVGTIAQQENRMWDGNIELLPDMTLDLSQVKVKPIARYYNPDSTREPKFTAKFNPVSGRDDNDPITNSTTEIPSFTLSNFTGDNETYGAGVKKDYVNYKGQLFNFLYKGFFRGETQPFALVVIDRKGNPLFAQHITDYTFPNQYDTKDPEGNVTDWTLSRQNPDGSFDLRIMGAMLSNISLPSKILYDKFGKLNVSGFMIVRTERIKRIANQGLIFNCNISPNGSTVTQNDAYVHPMIFWNNNYSVNPTPLDIPDAHRYFAGIDGSTYLQNKEHHLSWPAFSAGSFFNYHSPDILIEEKLSEELTKGKFEKVGFVHKAYSETVDIFSSHHYSKLYKTSPIDFADEMVKIKNSRAKIGSQSRIKLAMIHDQSSVHIYPKFDPETSDQNDYRVHVQAFFPHNGLGSQGQWKATQQPNSVILKLMDWKLVDSIESPNSKASFSIVNWKVTPDVYYTDNDESSLEKRRYFSTGHFQPITEEILNKAAKTFNANGTVKDYVFNNIEVWGGDCYNTLFDFTRLYPDYQNCVQFSNAYPDYSVSLIAPIESKYNLSLLYGRKFAANAVMPMRTSCTGENKHLSNGIKPIQPEDWSYNEVLLLQETAKFYTPKPADVKIVTSRPSTIWWSPKKVYGELEDSYRQRLVYDYGDAIGEHGSIQRFVQAFNYLYCIQESGFGLLQTNLKTMIPSDTGDIFVKSADVFSGVQYYSKTYGTQHPNSAWARENQLGFTDARNGKILVFSQAGLKKESEEDGLNDPIMAKTIYFDRSIEHDPENGIFVDIVAAVDKENEDVLITFHHQIPMQVPGNIDDRINELKSFTIHYNLNQNLFHGFQPFTPYIYFNNGRYLLSTRPEVGKENQVYIHNHGKYGQWYEQYHPTRIIIEVNPQPNAEKVYDNAVINVNEEGFRRISEIIGKCKENSHNLILTEKVSGALVYPDDRADYRESSLKLPLHEYDWEGLKERLRGKVLRLEIVIDNSQQDIDGIDQQVAITSIDTLFRLSHHIQY
ncbi:hypothetical protein [Dyadobacter sp. CY312]|uniref:hypothetical protein n=1 Tax=Dyadobacter sp. CY312 TaxID=2907303 RepID=UPI001F372669|nr:hypothetical protein [Dyadobacter sp. CY312]MCE7039232.1 hypothetical protein [Dyadobacter sp. CY312]